MSTNKRKCCQMKKMTDKEATTEIRIEYGSNLLPKTRKNVAIKATIIAPIDMKSVVSPIINLLSNDQRKLSGAIPPEIGNLNHIHVLNLSNNHLIGPIPQTLSNLSEIEIMDLSNNNLNGEIPSQLVQLHSLAYFSVANNNLSGKTPEMVAQFSTFDKSSYEGNPLLCGPPLLNSCAKEVPPPPPGSSTEEKEESSGIIDAQVFCVSFVVTYIMVLLGIAAVLYINQDWRRAWFYFIEKSINTCYYFVADNLLKPFRIRVWKPLV